MNGDEAMVELLCEQGADVHLLDREAHSVVHWITGEKRGEEVIFRRLYFQSVDTGICSTFFVDTTRPFTRPIITKPIRFITPLSC